MDTTRQVSNEDLDQTLAEIAVFEPITAAILHEEIHDTSRSMDAWSDTRDFIVNYHTLVQEGVS